MWSLISLDGVVPSRIVGVSSSIIFPCTIKSRRRFLLAPAYMDSSGKRTVKWLCVCVCSKIVIIWTFFKSSWFTLFQECNKSSRLNFTQYTVLPHNLMWPQITVTSLHPMYILIHCLMLQKCEQVVKVISQKKAALLPHMDDAVVFARWRKFTPYLIHASLGTPEFTIQTACWSVQPLLHSSVVGHAWACLFP